MLKGNTSVLITSAGDQTLFVPELNETYHSRDGAISESRHVFIQEGLQYYHSRNEPSELSIFEMGFGTGLNACLSAIFAEEYRLKISYHAVDAYPLSENLWAQLEYGKTLAEESLFQRICRSPWKSSISISPYFDLYKNHQKLEKVVFADARFDLIYFDAFAPGKQPELWSFEILEKLSKSLKRTGMFVTYSSAGHLKRNLLKLGFEVEKPGGANGKREMTRAIKL